MKNQELDPSVRSFVRSFVHYIQIRSSCTWIWGIIFYYGSYSTRVLVATDSQVSHLCYPS